MGVFFIAFPRYCEFMIIGHALPYNTLESALENKQHHGFLLSGPRGIGKATQARNLAIAALTKASPFSQKIVEQQCMAGAYPNYFYICQFKDDDGKLKNDITIEQVRTLLNSLKQKAAVAGPRIIIIDSVDNLNRQAANALLKMLEEPPHDAFFYLICHSIGSVMPTLRSRCLNINFKSLSDSDMAQVIVKQGHTVDPTIVSMASGSPGNYEKILAAGGSTTILAIQKLLMLTNLNDLKSAVQELLKLSDDTFLGHLLHQFLYHQALSEPETYAHPAQVVEKFMRYTHNTHLDGAHRLVAAVLLAQNPNHEQAIYG